MDAEGLRGLGVFDHPCSSNMVGIGWIVLLSSAQVRNLVPDADSKNILSERMEFSGLRWLGHMWCLVIYLMPCFPFLPQCGRNQRRVNR